jgi:hypothetical protein
MKFEFKNIFDKILSVFGYIPKMQINLLINRIDLLQKEISKYASSNLDKIEELKLNRIVSNYEMARLSQSDNKFSLLDYTKDRLTLEIAEGIKPFIVFTHEKDYQLGGEIRISAKLKLVDQRKNSSKAAIYKDNMTRSEHITWCKARALEYIEINDIQNAWASMASDLSKHPETYNHPAIELGFRLVMTGNFKTANDMRRFIEGFN